MEYIALAMLLLLPAQALGECSHAPFELIWAEKYRDGGTISVTVSDSVGCVVGFNLDGKIGSETRGRIYFREIHPDGIHHEAASAGIASEEEEDAILDLLGQVADSHVSRPTQMEILKNGRADSSDDEGGRYFGWLMELLQRKGRR
jgi:hypothetical protein